jgi:hypothetical protein
MVTAAAMGVMVMGPVNRRTTRSTLTSLQATDGNDCPMSLPPHITENH